MYILIYTYACIHLRSLYIYTHTRIYTYPRLQTIRFTKKCATKRATEMDFIESSWNREISRFAIASPDSPHVFRFIKRMENRHVSLKGQNFTWLMCMHGYIYICMLQDVAVCWSVLEYVAVCCTVHAWIHIHWVTRAPHKAYLTRNETRHTNTICLVTCKMWNSAFTLFLVTKAPHASCINEAYLTRNETHEYVTSISSNPHVHNAT